MMNVKRERYLYLAADNDPCFGNLLFSGISYVEEDYAVNRPYSDISVLEYVLEGSGTVVTPGGEKAHVHKGDVYFLPKDCAHYYYADNRQTQWAKIYINFGGDMFPQIMQQFGLGNTYIFYGFDILAEMQQIHECVRRAPSNTITQCASILYNIICKMHETTHAIQHVQNPDARKLKDYIDVHYGEKISIQALADLILKSESQTIRIFKKEYHITPYQYILNKKIEAAKALLRTTVPIKAIALDLSFSDEFYFSNVFKSITGMSPGQYRKNYYALP